MNIGTKSVLYGAHCFFIHPWFVALAWWRLYGFPFDPRLWFSFFLHDMGYVGKPNMDGEEGEEHPYWGAFVMGALFGKSWFDFTLCHSRFLAKKNLSNYSKLCVADKYSFCLTPKWLYLKMVNWTGEIKEYMKLAEAMNDGAGNGKYASMNISTEDQIEWFNDVKGYLKKWVEEHKELKIDTWTRAAKIASTGSGVWK
jgi:hypothetical protein